MSDQQAMTDAQAALAQLQAITLCAQTAIVKVNDAISQLQPVAPPPIPAPPPPVPAVNPLLARLQAWFGSDKVGVYTGIETHNDSLAQLEAIALDLSAKGADFALVKMGEGGALWHSAFFTQIRAAFWKHGIGFAPYWYGLPGGGDAQLQSCIQLAKLCGGIVLDTEDEYAGHDGEMAYLLNGLHAAVPDACVIVSGYGDPITRFGASGWPNHTLATGNITAYQPQAYIGVWSPYLDHGVDVALNWCVKECAQAFGSDIVLQPACNVQGIKSLADFAAIGRFWKPWKASICIWEYEQVTAAIIAAVRKGLTS